MRTQRLFTVIAALGCLVLLFAAAGSSSAMEPITIQFWNSFTGSDGDILREIVNRFNKENTDGITIEMDIMPGATLVEKLAPAIATNTAPALILAGNMDVPMYGKSGNMIPMDDFFETTGVDKADFETAALESLQYKGSQIMIPMQWFTQYLYYNKDLFKKAGLDPNTPPSSWAEVAEYAAKLTDSSQNIYGIGFCVSGGVTWFSSLFMSNGGQIVDTEHLKSLLVSEENLTTLKFIQDMVQKGYSPKGATGADLDNIMVADRLGMVINGPWMVNGLKENEINFGVTSFPAGSKTHQAVAETTGYCIPKGTPEEAKLAAYKFVAYWNTTAIGKEWSLRNGFPPYLKSVAADPDVQGNELVSVFAKISEYGVPFGISLTTTPQINADILFPMIENIVAGEDCEQELKNASDALDKLLATEQ